MPETTQPDSNKEKRDLDLFRDKGWDENDLDYYNATAKYIKAKSHNREDGLYLMPEDFIHFCSELELKGFHLTYWDYLQKFVQLYLNDWPNWKELQNFNIKTAVRNWYEDYLRRKGIKDTTEPRIPDKKELPNPECAVIPEREHVLILAIEISRLQTQLLEKIQSGSMTIEGDGLQDFYRLPWIWHYGPGELQDIKATLASELAVPEQDADSLIIGTMLKPVPGMRITPEIKGSEMRAVFEKLDGKTFKLLCEFRMADLGKTSIKFYRMP